MLWDVFYIGTANLAVGRIVARSAVEARRLAAAATNTPVAYLKAKRHTI